MGVSRVTEKSFMATVIAFAKLHGWKLYHTHDSRRSDAGFPDLVMVKGRKLVFAELKTDTGKLTKEQGDWLESLMNANQAFFVWRPSDWPDIERVLGSQT